MIVTASCPAHRVRGTRERTAYDPSPIYELCCYLTDPRNPRHIPPLRIDADAISWRLHRLATGPWCEQCDLSTLDAITDIARLLNEVSRLHHELIRTRREKANYEAAIRAALGAHHDGEPDPLAYLRDELAGHSGGAYGA